jgi:metallo beta-lactamase family protein
MLIDCGEASEADKVISYLQSMDVGKLDYVIATHPHSDHMGGMYRIIDEFDTGKVIIPEFDESDAPTTRYFEKFLDSCDKKGVKLSYAEKGSVLNIGSSEAEIIAPCSSDYSNVNNYSVGIFLMHGKTSFIFTGDAEKLAEEEMIQSGSLRHADVYKAGHHGSDTSSSKDFMDIISPDYAVISCGAGNSYGHPCESTLETLSEFTDKIYRTDLCGTIVFVSDGENISVRTERQ